MPRQHPPSSRATRTDRTGFTIVELLVVIGLVAMLSGLLVTVLGSLREQAQNVLERNAARQASVAWTGYAIDNNSELLPGYKSGLPAWTPEGEPIETETVGVVANRYPWRLAPYLDHNFDTLYVNGQNDVLNELRTRSYGDYLYVAATFPSLGLNTTWVGGDEIDGCFNPNLVNLLGQFYSNRLGGVRNPTRVIVFCSARATEGVPGAGGGITEGYFKVSSPNFNTRRWQDLYDPDLPLSAGNISARWGTDDEAVVSRVDGSVDGLNILELDDMRNWADMATTPDWMLTPP